MKENKEKEPKNEEKKQSGEVSRRDFLVGAGTVVVGGAIGAGMLSGCGGDATTTVVSTVPTTKTVTTTVQGGTGGVTTTVQGGTGVATVTTTKTVTEPGSGGGAVPPALEPETSFQASPNYGLIHGSFDVKNGKMVRTRPTILDPDISWSMKARGTTWTSSRIASLSPYHLAYRKRHNNPMRILYPLKRVDWEPGGDPAKINAQNRGISKYKRISWDEAAGIIAGELKRVSETYGTEALCDTAQATHNEGHVVQGSQQAVAAFLDYWAMSNYGTPITDTHFHGQSAASGQLGGKFCWGENYESGQMVPNVAENAELLISLGSDPVTKSWLVTGSMCSTTMKWFKDLGIKQVWVNPDVNHSVGLYADKWIPVIPGTDHAYMLAIAYIWITEGTYNKDYIDSHTLGFDVFKSYVLGDQDGVPKTPEWASEICGIPVRIIKALAKAWASKVTSTAHSGYCSLGRGVYGESFLRIEITLLAMQGLGAPGRHFMRYYGNGPFPTRPLLAAVKPDTRWMSAIAKKLGKQLTSTDKDRQFMPKNLFWKGILNPPIEYCDVNDPLYKRVYPMEGKSEVHMMWATAGSWGASQCCGFEIQKAYQSPKLECIVTQTIAMEDTVVFSDVILPICCFPEFDDIVSQAHFNPILSMGVLRQAVERLGESKTDYEAILEVAKKLDFYDEATEGKSIEDLIKEGYEKSGWKDLVSFEDLNEKGHLIAPAKNWQDGYVTPYEKFYLDPTKNPLKTPSGLIEIESSLLKENFPDDKERCPSPIFPRGGSEADGYLHDEDRILSPRAKLYPLKMESANPVYREHGQHIAYPWPREIYKIKCWDGHWYEPVWISLKDAEARGIEDGDIVRVFNERGGVLGGAYVTDRMADGGVRMDHGGGSGDDIIPTELNRGGNPNCICPGNPTSRYAHGQVVTGYLVQVEKVTGNQMDEWRKNYPQAFAGDYDPAYGPAFTSWVVEGDK